MSGPGRELDLRLVPLAVAVWAVVAVVPVVPATWTVLTAITSAAAATVLLGTCRWPRRGLRAAVAVVLLGVSAGAAVGGLHVSAARAGPVLRLAAEGAVATAELRITSDPVLHARKGPGRAPYVVVRATVVVLRARGTVSHIATPVLVIGPESWLRVRMGRRVRALGRLGPMDPGSRETALFSARSPPELFAEAGSLDRAAEHLRSGLRAAVAGLPEEERGLVPALVVGDTSHMPQALTDDFRTAGLTHLTAVSGANLTIVLIFVLGAARRAGVRSWGLPVLGLVCVAGFVLVARPDPSVLRAAAMGVVGLAGTVFGSRRHGVPAVALAVILLLLIDPWLGRSYGFALSVLATSGIVFLAGPWTDELARWLPRWAGAAIAVPLAAQLACTPLVAVLSGEVSAVAVVANLLAGYAVFPATVAGVLTMLVAVVSLPAAAVIARPAGWAARWIVEVGTHAADVPGASLAWPSTPASIVALGLACVLAIVFAHRVLSRRGLMLALTAALVFWLVQPVPVAPVPAWLRGWPPAGWVLVACDVGQGDALVLRSAPGAAVVVDTGPDPGAADACLDRLGVDTIPYVLLTHFHADHTGGLSGVLRGRSVTEIGVRPFAHPSLLREEVGVARPAGVPVTVAEPGSRRRAGEVAWTVLAPAGPAAGTAVTADLPGVDEGSAENDASVVIEAEVQGVEILLTGDVEPAAQLALLRTGADLRADILKVPHHGSRYQSRAFLAAVGPRLALISVGEDNDYGHPARSTIRVLVGLGAAVLRTDVSGDIAVVATADGLRIATRQGGLTG